MSGRCIAGKIVNGNRYSDWLRPVSSRQDGEVSEEERRYENGSDPRVLDIIDIPLLKPVPSGFQTENYLLDDKYYWSSKGRKSWHDIAAAVDVIKGPLWWNGDSSYNGINDRVPASEYKKLSSSLLLIRPEGLKIHVGQGYNKREVRASFSYSTNDYKLKVTDPIAERLYLSGPDGSNGVSDADLCISLGEPFNGFTYKLVAALVTP